MLTPNANLQAAPCPPHTHPFLPFSGVLFLRSTHFVCSCKFGAAPYAMAGTLWHSYLFPPCTRLVPSPLGNVSQPLLSLVGPCLLDVRASLSDGNQAITLCLEESDRCGSFYTTGRVSGHKGSQPAGAPRGPLNHKNMF